MAKPGRHARGRDRAPGLSDGLRSTVWSTALLTIVSLLAVVVMIASPVHTAADSVRSQMAPSMPLAGRAFGGTAAVGALFMNGAAGQGGHFCTASVVDSPNRNLVITAAHCLARFPASQAITFVPGYHDQRAPYGVWATARVVVDHDWASSADPDDDVAFLVVNGGRGGKIEDVTGAEQLADGTPSGVVQVIGYPNTGERPVSCRNWPTMFDATQLRFDCAGFTNGTSGGPFLADVNPTTGNGLVVGVVGGYQQGGYTPQISYSPTFRANVTALYWSAVAVS